MKEEEEITEEMVEALPLPDLGEAFSAALDMDRLAGSLLLGLKVTKKALPGSYGIATDGVHLFVDPARIQKLTPEELPSALIHEACHVGMLHPLRLRGMEQVRGMLAADFAVNEILHTGNFQLAEHVLLDNHASWEKLGRPAPLPPEHRALSAEEYYAEFPSQPKECHGCGGLHPAPEGAEQEMVERVRNAIAGAQPGVLKGQFSAEVDAALAGPPKWLGLLRRFTRGVARGMSWRSFNRKLVQGGVYLPGRRSPAHKTLLVWVDTSGSVPDKDLQAHLTSIRGILSEDPPEELILGQFDAEVQNVRVIKRGDEWGKVQVHGRGGTDFRPPLAWTKGGVIPDAVIVLSDGEGPFPPSPPPFPLLWVLTTDVNPPFGLVARVSE